MNVFDEMAQGGGSAAGHATKKEYRLIYLAGENGIGKRVEFSAIDLDEAVKRASYDAMGRIVKVFENGVFVRTVFP